MKRELENYIKEIAGAEIALDYPPAGGGGKFGDFASSAAFKLAKSAGKPPMAVAEELAKEIREKDGEKMFERVGAVAPGFVNFWVKREIFLKSIFGYATSEVLEEAYPRARINLEFVSANPTGPLTMANGRGGFLGDVLARVLEIAGYEVTREYYINDAGVQIKKLGESVLAALGMAEKSEEHYQGEYIKELAEKLKEKILKAHQGKIASRGLAMTEGEIARKHEENPHLNPPPQEAGGKEEEIGRLVAKELLASIKKSIKNVGIKYDKWFSEYKDLRKKGELEKTLALLRERGMVYDKEGAVWLRTSQEQENPHLNPPPQREGGKNADDKDRVLIKSDGEATYFLADLAYHYNKFIERKFDQAIVIWGADHHGYVPRMKSGLEAMGVESDKFKAIIVQLIRLVRDGEEVKMSKRKGEFITLDDLIKEVGKDAARFFFLMHSPETHMDFDLDLAKEKSVKNPVYYAQYAYVRCRSILKKAKMSRDPSAALRMTSGGGKTELLDSEAEIKLIKELVKLEDMILDTAGDFQVSRLIRYAMELSRAVHNFYEHERVIVEDKDLMEARLALVAAAKNIFERLFEVLGITKLKKM